MYQMDHHQDQEPPSNAGDPDTNAQAHHRAYGFPEFNLDFVFRQRQLLPQELLRIMH